MNQKLYAMAQLPNAGLCNRLFTWGRCKLFSIRNNIPMLAPDWVQYKIGPTVRREADPRWYSGQFQPAPGEISGIKKWGLKCFAQKLPEVSKCDPAQKGLIVFKDMTGFFGPLNSGHRELRAALELATRPDKRAAAGVFGRDFIACHVRRGDMTHADGRFTMPIGWYEAVVRLVRNELGRKEPILVFSDGTDQELGGLLSFPQVKRVTTGTAIGDLWALSQSKFLIASGGSTFSLWSAFLGRMPFVVAPGHPLSYHFIEPEPGLFSGELEPSNPDPAWLQSWRTE